METQAKTDDGFEIICDLKRALTARAIPQNMTAVPE
jgi:hypothetical protein